jgi:hypothetical protein
MITAACLVLIAWIVGVLVVWATLTARQTILGMLFRIAISLVPLLALVPLFVLLIPMPPRLVFWNLAFVQAGVAVVGAGTGIGARLFGYRLHKWA